MPSAAERQAIAFLATVAVLGGGVRALQARAFDRALDAAALEAIGGERMDDARGGDGPAGRAAGAAALERQLAAVVAARESSKKGAKKSGPPAEPIDVDVASASALEALPRVGPALAARIIASRDSLGPFGSLEELQRVKGIGPALASGLAPYVTFSSGLRPLHGTSTVGRPR